MKDFRFFPLILLCVITACSSAPKTGPTRIALEDTSSFEISYWLGEHGEHRLSGSMGAISGTHVVSYLNTEVVDEGQVGSEGYNKYIAKLQSFMKQSKIENFAGGETQRAPSQEGECRTPFTIVLKINGITHTSKGCRSSEEDAAFSKLVREGEFLLYSKK